MENVIIECPCQQENIWTILLAIIPILVAIAVPIWIANEQNKIALYEKRFECYQQLESLKAFWLSLKCITSFTSSKETQSNPVWSCQQNYFNAHALLDDKDFQRNRYDHFHQISYARSCLEADRKMLLSLKLLVGGKNTEEQLDQTQVALEAFIYALFNEEEKNITQNMDSNMAFIDTELLSKRDSFVAEFEKTLKLENKLEKLLRMKKARRKKAH